LKALEPSFHQDLNGDGVIGVPTTVLDGHLGAQTLTAGGGPTTLIGGPNDILNAGAGADTFVFRPNFGLNTINGFAAGTDVIQFDHTIFADVADVQSHMQQIGSDVVIAYRPQNVVTLHDVLLADLHMSDFLIV
jgi:Ca2+-binding RTX toxin-like protein